MIVRTAPPRQQRLAVLAAVFVLHAALICLFLFQRAANRSPPPEPIAIALLTLDAERPTAAKPPPPALPAPIAKTFTPIIIVSTPSDDDSVSAPGATGPCSVATAVLDAVLIDPASVEAIQRAPRETRSVAGALVIWNIDWNPATATPADTLYTVRDTVQRSLASLPANCLDEPVVGPRLLPIPDGTGEGTVFMVFGSGNWTWRGLLLPPTPANPTGGPLAPISPAPIKPPVAK